MSSQSITSKVNSERKIYIYDMPYTIRQKLCAVLDIDDNWKVLAEKYMEFDNQDIVVSEDKNIVKVRIYFYHLLLFLR